MELNAGKRWKSVHQETEKQKKNKNNTEVGYKRSRKGAQKEGRRI